ncbi:hypothetical protein COS55_03860 [Candidatus Shapirobacteria bacterium CG03_land_8_20_14_0_80_40_19]|uniref:Uncharacterized protein n=4 Tax=Candidatus Shapironibacteriota TaxID=1752721 RepID=A0A2M7BB30_9BACT|nr:MAG: hypothetical protein COV89_01880 [Candidatus Shapirobacteria bacterium CG11_big_fil_rev_8_21_14_0_20_40_12]PIV00306.1 MAG: hypothetical protein COS55_03860 [Candidatus Shapirobacteria bacterium CG03_land_8_20_14_0_80_40_19]PJC28697.1 MAG: hypothetical protein CO053_03120 [Candidatus Shapirobacteria bacterium CG_4_9_14_0_2_um_filter_40_11]PJC76073.1 MAG: hypothetical protein CO010_03635 [Candidatus Shapirobacteria bacterium CG_4_8_14_3_um_filter_39_11]
METSQEKLLKQISSFLEKSEIPYMITGAWSVIYYGRPRASHDIDFVVEINQKDIKKTLNAVKNLSEDFLIQADVIKEAVRNKDMFNILHLPTTLKLDFWLLTEDLFDKSRFSRKRRVKILDQFMEISSPEDTILQKLRWYKEAKIEKHLVDAAFVYQIQKKNLNMDYLKKWVEDLKLVDYFKGLKKITLDDYI